jgi:hypothetical protein
VTIIGELGTTLAGTSYGRTLRRYTITVATRLNIPEDGILHSHRRENLKYYERRQLQEASKLMLTYYVRLECIKHHNMQTGVYVGDNSFHFILKLKETVLALWELQGFRIGCVKRRSVVTFIMCYGSDAHFYLSFCVQRRNLNNLSKLSLLDDGFPFAFISFSSFRYSF